MNGNPTVFGVNFADGRIKGYPKLRPGPSYVSWTLCAASAARPAERTKVQPPFILSDKVH
jgi:hypothetical protein